MPIKTHWSDKFRVDCKHVDLSIYNKGIIIEFDALFKKEFLEIADYDVRKTYFHNDELYYVFWFIRRILKKHPETGIKNTFKTKEIKQDNGDILVEYKLVSQGNKRNFNDQNVKYRIFGILTLIEILKKCLEDDYIKRLEIREIT